MSDHCAGAGATFAVAVVVVVVVVPTWHVSSRSLHPNSHSATMGRSSGKVLQGTSSGWGSERVWEAAWKRAHCYCWISDGHSSC